MKKLLFLALVLGVLLSGCTGDRYTEKESQAQEARGLEILYAAFAQRELPLTVVTSNALEDFVAGGPHYLSEFMGGQYRDDDGIWEYRVNVNTGEVYTSRYYAELEKLVKETLLRELGLGEEVFWEKLTITITLPHSVEHSGSWGNAWTGPLLPLGMDAQAYLEAADAREPIRIRECVISVPGGMEGERPELPEDMGLVLTHTPIILDSTAEKAPEG